MADISLYIGNPVCVELGLVASCDDPDTPVTDATVEVTIVDDDGAEVAGETWPVAMPWSSGDAVYRGIVSAGVALVDGVYYRVNVVAKNIDNDVIGSWSPKIRARYRRLK